MAAEQGKGTGAGRVSALNFERIYRTTVPAEELAGELAFAIPPDTWEEFTVPIPTRSGRVRVTISVDPLRVPRDRVPGSLYNRGLGLAVKRLWLV